LGNFFLFRKPEMPTFYTTLKNIATKYSNTYPISPFRSYLFFAGFSNRILL
jgi:hypothetical protein